MLHSMSLLPVLCGDTYNPDCAYEKKCNNYNKFTSNFFATPATHRDTLLTTVVSLPEGLGEVRCHAIPCTPSRMWSAAVVASFPSFAFLIIAHICILVKVLS
jgi:hypothetical protein